MGLRGISVVDNLKEYPSSCFVVHVGDERFIAVCWGVVSFGVNFPGNLGSLVIVRDGYVICNTACTPWFIEPLINFFFLHFYDSLQVPLHT